jgi:hypothetical protein
MKRGFYQVVKSADDSQQSDDKPKQRTDIYLRASTESSIRVKPNREDAYE